MSIGLKADAAGVSVNTSVLVNDVERLKISSTDYFQLNTTTAARIPTGTTAQRPTGTAGKIRYNSENKAIEVFGNLAWRTVGALDGSSSSFAAPSAVYLKNVAGVTQNGTYWINVGGTPTQIYCNFTTAGGGWMSFASAPASGGWFAGDTGNMTSWVNLNYSYGTYSTIGSIGNYWRNYSAQPVSEILMMTGNGTYWIKFMLSYVSAAAGSDAAYTTNVLTSNNFPDNSKSANTTVDILNRSGGGSIGEDPWIIAANTHQSSNASTDYSFWGEMGVTGHEAFKNSNGGIIAFVR